MNYFSAVGMEIEVAFVGFSHHHIARPYMAVYMVQVLCGRGKPRLVVNSTYFANRQFESLLPPPLKNCVILGKLVNLSVSQNSPICKKKKGGDRK